MDSAQLLIRKACPGCACSSSRELYSTRYSDPLLAHYLSRHYEGKCDLSGIADDEYTLVQCDQCGLMFQKAVPDALLLEEIYDRWLGGETRQQLAAHYQLSGYRSLAWQVDTLIQQSGKHPSKLRVLDFGMGWGEWANMARSFGCEVLGAELSRERIAYAGSVGIPIVPFEDIPGMALDFINAEQVFEHLVEPFTVLQHLSRGLSSTGILRLSVPDCRPSVTAIKALSRRKTLERDSLITIAPLEHVNSFTARSLRAMGSRAGLKEHPPSLLQIYHSYSGWFSISGAIKNALRPIYQVVYPKTTVAYFKWS